jgi:HSP20 family protein
MAEESKHQIEVTSEPKAAREVKKAAVPAVRPLVEAERLLDRLMGRGWLSPFAWSSPLLADLFEPLETRLPSLDVIDRDEEIVVRAEVPGVDKKDLDVSLSDNMLTIKGQSSREEKEEKGDYHRREISRSAFARTVTLPGAVDASKATASMKDGILEIILPKVEGSKRRSITVQ